MTANFASRGRPHILAVHVTPAVMTPFRLIPPGRSLPNACDDLSFDLDMLSAQVVRNSPCRLECSV